MSAQRRSLLLLTLGMVALAFNLRPVAVAVAPVLGDIRADLAMSATTAGVLTTLPVLAFSAFGALAPWCARRLGMHRVILAALLLAAGGMAARVATDSSAMFLLLSVPALAGMATANVLLPSLVKLHFPSRIGLMTSVYTTVLAFGMTVVSVLTVPLSAATGSWRYGLLLWAVTAALAALPWVALTSHDIRPVNGSGTHISVREMARTRLAWVTAVFFGTQALQAYAAFGWLPQIFRDAGFSAATSGLLLGVATGIGIPVSFVLPPLAARIANPTPLVLALCGCYAIGYAGLIVAPVAGAWAWATLVGLGTGIFPLVLTLIGLRTLTSEGTAALSGFAQSVGYLLGAVGPLMMGVLNDATGGWTVPLCVLIAILIPQAVAGALVCRPRNLEAELSSSS